MSLDAHAGNRTLPFRLSDGERVYKSRGSDHELHAQLLEVLFPSAVILSLQASHLAGSYSSAPVSGLCRQPCRSEPRFHPWLLASVSHTSIEASVHHPPMYRAALTVVQFGAVFSCGRDWRDYAPLKGLTIEC